MKEYNSLIDIPFAQERAIIINVHTLQCTTLAILSTLRYMDMPLLVVDCPLHGESDMEPLRQLQQQYDFDLISMPLRQHGDTLDDIFLHLQADWLYLVDSDIEVLNGDALHLMREMRRHNEISETRIFGVGMRQVSGYGLPPQERYFHAERMWIPYCCLHSQLVKNAIKKGGSFNICTTKNYTRIGDVICKVRNRLQRYGCYRMATLVDEILNNFRLKYKERKVDTILYDTGSMIYEKMRKSGLHYIDISFYCHPAFVTHFCGVTRNAMYEDEPVSVSEEQVENIILSNLRDKFHFDFKTYFAKN